MTRLFFALRNDMRSFVIAIDGNVESQASADRCIKSGKEHGTYIEKFDAVIPKSDVYKICNELGITTNRFTDKHSRIENAIGCFLSHYVLWKTSISINEPIAIFEHDAIITAPLPDTPPKYCGIIGAPSYGRFKTPSYEGWGKLRSHTYFLGTHAYMVTPEGAESLIAKSNNEACPPDYYLHISRFEWLEEYYPWCAHADDNFTTIQRAEGCRPKHGYNDEYRFVDV